MMRGGLLLLTAVLRMRGGSRMLIGALLLLAAAPCLALLTVGTLLQRSMLPWPAPAPVRVDAARPAYPAGGWQVAVPFGWVPDPERPGSWMLHDGLLLVGPVFCPGCPVPPIADMRVTEVGWDRPFAPDPLRAGAGVTAEFAVLHPDESGTVQGAPLVVRYGRLQPYRVYVRAEACRREVTCPDYAPSDAAAVTVACPGVMVETYAGVGEWHYAYATPGRCTASVRWPDDWTPVGPQQVWFDQRIAPGERSSDAAISFRAEAPPPPPTPTPAPTPIPTSLPLTPESAPSGRTP